MSRPSSSIAEALSTRFRTLDATRRQIERLSPKQLISNRAAEQMYEALYISAFASLEIFLEELFIGLLVEDSGLRSSQTDVIPRVRIKSHRVAREIIIGASRDYTDWLPYNRTAARADLFFRGGRPFSLLSDGDRSQLKACAVVRNAIAHRSRFSLREFEKKVIGSTPLPPRERRPAGYLRGQGSAAPPRTRFESLLGTMLRVARTLAA